jgi:hypothetical protein
MGDIGLEPMTPSLSSGGANVLSLADTRLTASPPERCTTRCTKTAVEHDALAAAVRLVAGLPLTDADRHAILARLAERTGRTPPA